MSARQKDQLARREIGESHRVGSPNDPSLPKQGKIVSTTTHAKLKTSALTTCNTHITPECLQALYELPTDAPFAEGSEYAPSPMASDLTIYRFIWNCRIYATSISPWG